ncbi:MAG TPA: hypothetical protein V6C97_10080 [Oculatellaceae cyanobacterium]
MVDQDIKAEAKKIENLANRSLNGDHQTATDAANRLRTESQDIMNASPTYRAALQKQLDADQKAELARISKSDTADKWLPDITVDKDKIEISKVDGRGGYKDIETFHKDGSVGFQKNHFADEVPVNGVGDATVKKNADDKVESIKRPDQSETKIERDANGDPTKITGIEGQIWTKKAGTDNEWAVTDMKGNPMIMNPTRTNVEVAANGDVKSTGFFGETRVVHPDGSNDTTFKHGQESVTFRSADGSRLVTNGNEYTEYNADGTVRKTNHVVAHAPSRQAAGSHKNAGPSNDSPFTKKSKGACAPGDPLCSDI